MVRAPAPCENFRAPDSKRSFKRVSAGFEKEGFFSGIGEGLCADTVRGPAAPPSSVRSAPVPGKTPPQCAQRTEDSGFSPPQVLQIMIATPGRGNNVRRIILHREPYQQAVFSNINAGKAL